MERKLRCSCVGLFVLEHFKISVKLALLALLLFINTKAFAQAPGCPGVDAGADITLDCNTDCANISATFLPTGETDSYDITSIPYDPPFPFTGLSNPISVGQDDVWSSPVDLPFDFSFFGINYDRVYIGSNGIISFNTQTPNDFCDYSLGATEQLPNPAVHQNAIMLYHDIDPRFGNAEIGYEVLGAAPCRTLVVSFANVQYYSVSQSITTFQMVLYETTNTIEFYVESKPDPNDFSSFPINGGRAVLGIQNNGGTEAFTPPNRNTGVWEAFDEAWRFSPNGSSIVDFAWLDESGSVIGTNPTMQVCPVYFPATYTAQATYNLPTGAVLVETDDVTVSRDVFFDVSIGNDQAFCDVSSYMLETEITGGDPNNATYEWFLDNVSLGVTTPDIEATQSGLYRVDVTLTSCTTSDEALIQLEESPNVDLGSDFTTCFENQIFLNASPSNYAVSDVAFEWALDGNVLPETGFELEVLDYGTYTVTVTADFCATQEQITISPKDDLVVSLSSPISACADETFTITANTEEEGVTYTWYVNGDELSGETASSIEVTTPLEASNMPEVYKVEITKGDCFGSAETEVDVLKCTITQGISPGGSVGQNDNLDLEFIANRTGVEKIQIFNRSGSLVYEKQNYVNEWEGQSMDGHELPTGTYFYVINFSAEDPEFGSETNGWIYINRAAN